MRHIWRYYNGKFVTGQLTIDGQFIDQRDGTTRVGLSQDNYVLICVFPAKHVDAPILTLKTHEISVRKQSTIGYKISNVQVKFDNYWVTIYLDSADLFLSNEEIKRKVFSHKRLQLYLLMILVAILYAIFLGNGLDLKFIAYMGIYSVLFSWIVTFKENKYNVLNNSEVHAN